MSIGYVHSVLMQGTPDSNSHLCFVSFLAEANAPSREGD
jgi:hypothetical protein